MLFVVLVCVVCCSLRVVCCVLIGVRCVLFVAVCNCWMCCLLLFAVARFLYVA